VGLRGLGRGARKTHKAWRSSASALLIIPPPPPHTSTLHCSCGAHPRPVLHLRCARCGGGHRPARSWRHSARGSLLPGPPRLRSRGPDGAEGAAQQRRYRVRYIPPRKCPSSTPAPPTPLSKRTCGALTNAKSARRATSSSPSPSVRQGRGAGTATHDAGGLPQGSSYFLGQPWLRPRDSKEAGGVARQRRCPVKYKPPPKMPLITPRDKPRPPVP
jgi:hypothetical protein